MQPVSAGEKRRRANEAAEAKREAVIAATPNKKRKLHAGPGASEVMSTRFEREEHFKNADVVVVDNLAVRTYSEEALCARLYGKALCDSEWVRSNGLRGTCVQHLSVRDRPPLCLYLSAEFQNERPAVSDHLTKVGAKWGQHSFRDPGGKKVTKTTLRVVGGKPPDSCGGPVKTVFVVTDAELKKEKKVKRRGVAVVSVEGLAIELGSGAVRV